jgi:internalin A
MKNLSAIIGLLICVVPMMPSMATSLQQSNSKSFAQWCKEKDSVSAATKKTINSLLDQAGTKNCKAAAAHLENLTELNISNKISDLRPLASLKNLTTLNLESNQIVDVSPLAGLTKLTYLNLNANRIVNISPLSKLSELKLLSLIGNRITDIKPLGKLKKLTFIALSDNPIKNKVCPVKPASACAWIYE